MLVKRSSKKTNYVLPVSIASKTMFWYYDDEKSLFKAYYQLKVIQSKFKVIYPVILSD